jgi:lysophospholipase L1-like esterase
MLAVVLGVAALGLNHASQHVAFMGDSITWGWAFPRANFGVRGETTEQMLTRFPAQIVGHNFREVVILGGTNDTLLGLDQQATLANLGAMLDLASKSGVEPVLAEIPPIYTGGGVHLQAVAALNRGIIALGRTKGVKVVDYYDTLNGEPQDFSDGTHLKRRGYMRMEWQLVKVTNPFQ